ncbi:MAG TPA: hypothetical protein VGE55_12260 [Limnobacter sp.]|uniref:hypothetical protein n=1 Tax=Limnobacter sp. TaxID=2003368 RepID=UPI002ED7C5E7
MADGKWKESLLKSSLPLEHAVAELLAKNDWHVWGQYSYSRKNENGLGTDFSADIHASREYNEEGQCFGNLDVLIECKYASPGVKWVFLPYPETAQLFSGMLKVFEQGSNKRITNHKPVNSAEDGVEYCIRGISLHDSGFDENSINRGAYQLRYAMPRIAERVFSTDASDMHDEDIGVSFACAVLVTTAPLYCLKPGVTLDDVFAANSLDDVVEPAERLILWEEASPDLEEYTRTIYQEVLENGLEERIREYQRAFRPSANLKHPPNQGQGWWAMREAGSHVLVTTLKGLGDVLSTLDAAAREAMLGVEKIAEVRFDPEKGKVVISSLAKSGDGASEV